MKKIKGSYSFFLRGTHEEKSIVLRFRQGTMVDLKISIQKTINDKFWDKKRGWPKSNSSFERKEQLESRLNQIKHALDRAMESLDYQSGYSHIWLMGVLEKSMEQEVIQHYFLTEELEKYKENLTERTKNGIKGVAVTTIRNFNTTKMRIDKYEKHIRKRIKLTDLDLEFHNNYRKFATNTLGLALNSWK